MKTFNVIHYDPNRKVFEPYNVISYFVNRYEEELEKHKDYPRSLYYRVPITFEEFRNFVKRESQYQFWGRCQYEIILSDWPPSDPPVEEKWDIHDQIMMNLDTVTNLVMESVKRD
jgi:hypothetical protein